VTAHSRDELVGLALPLITWLTLAVKLPSTVAPTAPRVVTATWRKSLEYPHPDPIGSM
jgi:hypothetical protein